MRSTKKKLRKYKKNNKKTRKNRRTTKKVGGHIDSSKIFENILSIGFEIESNDIIKFTLTKDETTGKYILVNSALINYYLEYGFVDPNEYTYIKDTNEESFKTTNDSAEDTDFNELVEKIYYGEDEQQEGGQEHQEGPEEEAIEEYGEEDFEEQEDEDEEEEDENKFLILKIPHNQYLTQSDYDIKFRMDTSEKGKLRNFSSFTDTEFIATYYKPLQSSNIIKHYLFKSVRELHDHLAKLETINNSKMILKNHDEEIEIPKSINQLYVLPDTSLVYFNASLNNIQNYNIREDLDVVIQMTFSCNIMYCYRIMKQLLAIIDVKKYQNQFNQYSKNDTTNKNIQRILEKLDGVEHNSDYDDYAINTSMNIVNSLFNNYNNMYKTYTFNNESATTKIIKSYMFLIIYKLFIYLNSYVKNIDKPGNLLKYWLSFAPRHYNYNLFLELKKIIKNAFNIDDSEVSRIISQLLDEKILKDLYVYPIIKNKKLKLNVDVKNDPSLQSTYYGDPLFSIKSYFEYFDKYNADWLEANSIDEKSTKFDLKNDVIIIEFRDFPLYTYLELFSMADDKIKNEIIKNIVGVFNMRTLNYFISK
jgi:hypothetical protein